jgi:hypothetical protein
LIREYAQMTLGHLVQFFWFWPYDTSGVSKPRVVGNGYVYRWVSGSWPPTGTVTASAWVQGPWQSLRTAIPVEVTAWGLHVTSPIDPGAVDALSGVTQAGLRAGGRLPVLNSVRGVLRGALRGLAYRGSKLWSPVSSADVAGDELTAAGLALWQAATSWVSQDLVYADGPVTQVLRPVIWSRSLTPGPPFTAPAEGTDVTAIILDRTLGVLRHRKERTKR